MTANVSSGTSEIKPTEGNFNRDLWKRVALRMTQVNISPCQHEFDKRAFQIENSRNIFELADGIGIKVNFQCEKTFECLRFFCFI